MEDDPEIVAVSRYIQRKDHEWFDMGRQHFIACCDCGLVHLMSLRVRKGRFQMKAVRQSRMTAARRRELKKKNVKLV